MALIAYDVTPDAGNRHIALKRAGATTMDITFGDAQTDTETLIFNGLTWTFVASGASGREVLFGASAALTATAFITAFNAHADGLDYVASSGGSAVVTLTRTARGTFGPLTGTGATTATYTGDPVPGAGMTLIIDDAVITTRNTLDALWRVLRVLIQAESLTFTCRSTLISSQPVPSVSPSCTLSTNRVSSDPKRV